MPDLHAAMHTAAAAADPFPTVAVHVERAIALASFRAHDPRDGPYRAEPLSSGVPQPPAGPMFPALATIRGLDPLIDALERLQHELVWAADCAEFTDANLNAAQFLRAAGHLDLAQRAVLALAGPGLGLVLVPPVSVRDLAAGLGLPLPDLLANGSMGHLPAVDAHYRWDMHHEALVETVEALGPRELVSFSVRFDSGRARCEAALPSDPQVVAGRRRYGPFFVDAADTEAFTLEWYAEEPDWALPPVDAASRARALAACAERIRAATTEGEVAAALAAVEGATANGVALTLKPPMAAVDVATALGAPDAFARTVDVHMSSWRLARPAGAVRLGAWTVEATLDGAHGDPVPGVTLPAARACALTPADTVYAIRVS